MKLAKTYNPQAYEPEVYNLWENSGAFLPKGDPKKGYFSIVQPPTNANGNLHMGHALTVAIEDTAVRYHRLKGEATLYIPGADHAGFETWVVFERNLEAQGKTRFDYSRDELYSMVWDFVEQHRGNMEIQVRELGASVSWAHLTFTLDKKVIDQAYATFKKMWDDKLVYRGERLVNYCTKHRTAFADIEVVHKKEKTKLWDIAFALEGGEGELVISTTRPETKLGQSALMVHPDDERYKKFIGKNVLQPLVPGKPIPVVADKEVDPAFGTGVVTVTPAHDTHDFEVAQRLNLPLIELIGKDGKMTANVPKEFQGLTVLEARDAVVKALDAAGAMRGEKTYEHTVAHCYKCDTVIEPLLMEQWFVSVAPLVDRVKKAIANGDVHFVPKSKGTVLTHYLNNLKDWNISRQIPWGIPIPAFQNVDDPSDWIFDERVELPTITSGGKTYKRDEDTFDTWFSSGQWPYITTDYMTGGELKDFYPLSVMETGGDILFPWVSRMLMLGLYRTGQVPFKSVYLHGLVLDEHGQKMSKSKGNVINPQDALKEYGSDALRMGLLAGRSPGVNQAFSVATVIAGRNFANKLWNMSRFIEDKLGDDFADRTPQPKALADHWILDRLNKAAATIGKLIENDRYAEAYELMYHTIWDDVADWYIEASKSTTNKPMLAHVLQTILTIAHPFAPFVTETIWQTLAWEKTLLINSTWPTVAAANAAKAKQFEQLKNLVTEVRFVAASLGAGKQTLLFQADSLIEANQELVKHLARLNDVQKVGQGRGMRLAIAAHEVWLDVSADDVYEHQTKLEARLAETRANIERLQARLSNTSYIQKAPPAVVNETRAQLADQQAIEQRLTRELDVTKQ